MYDTVLKKAHARTFNLQKKLEANQLRIETDVEVEEVLAQPEQQELPEQANSILG
jgi:hypothetical protein